MRVIMLQIKYDVIFEQLRGVSELWRFIVEATKHKRMKSQAETCCQATVMPLWGEEEEDKIWTSRLQTLRWVSEVSRG